jgi:NitT/TauT family transport system substrate-binding protein
MHRSLTKRLAVGAIAGILLANTAACGSGDGSDSPDAKGLTKIVVALQPVTPFAQVPLGVEKGFFEKHGLDVEIRLISEATTIPPALLADQIQFSAWSYASFATLADQGLPLVTVGPGDTAGTDSKTDYTQLIALESSGIESTKDLAGKKVATNSLASLSQVQTMVALKNAGVDPESVEYIPIPYPDMAAALKAGQVDAAQMGEPFLTKTLAELDAISLDALDVAIMPNLPVSTWMAATKYTQNSPEIVRAFQLALSDSSRYAQSHPDEIRDFLPSLTGIDEATAQAMILPTWVTEVDPAKVQSVVDTMEEFGAIENPVDMSEFMLAPPAKE